MYWAEFRDEDPSPHLRTMLGILRRPQTERERASLVGLKLPMLDTIAAAGVRLSRSGRLQLIPGSARGRPTLVVLEHSAHQFGSVAVATSQTLRHPVLPGAARDGRVTEVIPDGVAVVEATLHDGCVIAEAVVDNLVQLEVGTDERNPFPVGIRWLEATGHELRRIAER